ncbi:MAG TPA: hypothetical protein VK735_17980 [Pseudonocardia sp.]|jgi:hypothetical protein|uniref:hypothetical protein n=1 Tax=Pseudonocardia sp. TaxID=60912 RepID=UPI002CEDF9E8|nr:hypothetical protein [Pseudonocardia sp.]HTF49335.1 hypothetical protein [Pseudonocardia sp.]
MSQVSVVRARKLWHAWVTPGTAPRAMPVPELVTVYRLWLAALLLKMLGAGWDVSWHFRWLRDDLAPPHLLNSAGTAMAVALVAFHSYTGYGVDRRALHLMQVGMGVFLVAIPLDLINHRINGLDITTWSATHGLLYLGTAVVMAGVIRGWALYGPPGRARWLTLGALWVFFLENVMFVAGQQEYGVVAVMAWDAGRPEAEPSLLQFAADQIGRPVDRVAVVHFALPVPAWVYLAWIVAAAMLVLVLARWMIGRRWAATAVTATYLAYRAVMWVLLVGTGFPRSAVPFLLLGGALAVDLMMSRPRFSARLSWVARPLIGAMLVAAAICGAAWLQDVLLIAPPLDYRSVAGAAGGLAAVWLGLAYLVRTPAFSRWAKER